MTYMYLFGLLVIIQRKNVSTYSCIEYERNGTTTIEITFNVISCYSSKDYKDIILM